MPSKLFFFLVLLTFSFQCLSQKQKAAKEEVQAPEHLRIAKLNVPAVLFKNVSAQYEMILSRKISVGLGFRLMPSTGIPFKNLLGGVIGEGPNVTEAVSKTRLSNIAVTPEMRIYLGRGYGQGFYIAPYYRYVRFKADEVTGSYRFKASGGAERKITVGGDLSAHNGGVLLGVQWPLGNRWNLDWWIVGVHFGSSKGLLAGRPDTPFSPAEQEEIKNYIEDVDIPLVNKTVNINASRINVNFDGAFGGIRSGVCLGFRF